MKAPHSLDRGIEPLAMPTACWRQRLLLPNTPSLPVAMLPTELTMAEPTYYMTPLDPGPVPTQDLLFFEGGDSATID